MQRTESDRQDRRNRMKMKTYIFLTVLLPYILFGILYLLYCAKVIGTNLMNPLLYWVILAIGITVYGMIFSWFVRLLSQIKKDEMWILLFHGINISILIFLIRATMRQELPFYNQFAFTFLIIGAYGANAIRLVLDRK